MIDELSNVRAVRQDTSVDRWLDAQEKKKPAPPPHPLDTPEKKRLHRRLLEWWHQERESQAENRLQMAIDHDFYDNIQWDEEDERELEERGQRALVYNEVAPTCDWIIGTEKRTRIDFKVLPRTDDDVKTADAKTQVLKWHADVNKAHFARSRAFSDAVKGGIGWLEDGARGDPTDEPLFSRYENWRYIWWDTKGTERDGSDWRYLFRVKWIDLDIAEAMFPERCAVLRRAAVSVNLWGNEEDEDLWYLGQHYQSRSASGQVTGRRNYLSDTGLLFNTRPRVKLIEAWYRIPVRQMVMRGDVFNGQVYSPKNQKMKQAVDAGAVSLYDKLEMQVRCAVMTEGDLVQDMKSPYRHNRFPFTPIFCYQRNRDGNVYGAIRRIRDPQEDLNKRASKTLFLLSVNRVTADSDAVEDHDEAREEAARPDMYIIKKPGREFSVENNMQLAEGHLLLMDRDSRMVRQAGGVTDDNLGRATNAISGEAIKARQLQGSVVTAEIFDNLRYAVQCQGELQLSLVEQYLTEQKVIRLTQARGQIQWLKINQPEQDGMGNWRYVNDITANQSDFKVDEQDFHQSVRQAMFDSMVDLVGKIAQVSADAGLRILKMALEFSDLPNKTEMASEIASILGIDEPPDLSSMTPEQQAEYAQRQQAKQQQQAIQQQQLQLAMAEQNAKVAKLNAEASKIAADADRIKAEAQQLLNGDNGAAETALRAELERKAAEIERNAAQMVEDARAELEKAQAKLDDRRYEIDTDSRTKKEIAKIEADAKVRAADITQQIQGIVGGLEKQIADMGTAMKEMQSALTKAEQERDRAVKEQDRRAREKPPAPPAPVQPPSIVFEKGAIQINREGGATGKTVSLKLPDGRKVEMDIKNKGGGRSDADD